MPEIVTTDRTAWVTTSLPDGRLALEAISGHESLGSPFAYELSLVSLDTDVDLAGLLGQPMTVHLTLPAGERQLNGIVVHAEHGLTDGEFTRYRVTLCPWLSLLTYASNCRIFQAQSVVDIIKAVFRDNGFSDFEDALSGTYAPLDYCVQYRESDFNFVSRLMEREGIYYFFKHADDKHTLVLADGYGAHEAAPGYEQVEYKPPQESMDDEHINSWVVGQQVRSGSFAATDFDFTRPRASLLSQLNAPLDNAHANFSLFDYPGQFLTADDGNNRVKMRLQEAQVSYVRVDATGNTRGLCAGGLFTLTDFPRDDQNKEYLIVSVNFHLQAAAFDSRGGGGGGGEFQASYSLLDSQTQFRPSFHAVKPRVAGPQTAIVVGQAGEEIWTDQYGRVKVQFQWDREGQNDENSSCWVRVAQVWAGAKWGAIHIPRIGQEVIVDFLEGDPDRPIITGRVYNADNMPPYDLPANQTQSGIKSRSTKGGAPTNFNEIRFEDKKGAEEMHIQAEKNQTIKVKQNRSASVGGGDSVSVGGDRSLTVNGNLAITVKGGGNSDDQSTQEVTGGYRLHATDRIDLVAPTYIKLTVGSTYIEITKDTIKLHAVGGGEVIVTPDIEAHSSGGKSALHLDGDAKMSTAGTATVTGAVLMAHGDGSATIQGKTLTATGTDTAELHSKDVTVSGETKTLVSGGGANITETASGVDVKGQEIKLNG